MYIPEIILIILFTIGIFYFDIKPKSRAEEEKQENNNHIKSLEKEIFDLSEKNYVLEKEKKELESNLSTYEVYAKLLEKLYSAPAKSLYGYTRNELSIIMLKNREYFSMFNEACIDIDLTDIEYIIKLALCGHLGYLKIYQNSDNSTYKRLTPNRKFVELSENELYMMQDYEYDFILDSIKDSELVKK